MFDRYQQLKQGLARRLDAAQIIDDPLRTLAYGTDASFYRMVPRLVVKLRNESELRELLALANRFETPVTFRAAGTSLSGQAVTDSVLALLDGEHWQGCEVSAAGDQIRLQPGVIGADANARLAAFGRKIGPDPASINAARIGGIAANNASGMCCGTAQNSYNTLHAMRLVLADGAVLDTADAASVEAFRGSHRELLNGLSTLVEELRAKPKLADRIRHKYRLKNTTGYGLNALLDFDDPVDVLSHLMIGSEGTLGFIASITYRTVVEHPHKATALVLFDTLEAACNRVSALKDEPVDAVELMDRPALRSVQARPGMPDGLADLGPQAAALLVDVRAADCQRLQQRIEQVSAVLAEGQPVAAVHFETDPAQYARLWGVRKGLFPAVGAMRRVGTTVVIEDIAVPVERLAAATRELQGLFDVHGYDEAIIFGHALAGNLHFVFTQDFSTEAEVDRYHRFMQDVSELVAVRYQGSLKAEHGTGRNMAPFVRLEWGDELYGLMQRIKRLLDPRGLLNPGVILNEDQHAHIRHLKGLPAADAQVDRCIECGFCEAVCPSRNLTLTPRQRIVGLREMARLEVSGQGNGRLEQLRDDFRYQGIETCAADGLCADRCPVGIDTGAMIRSLRARAVSPTAERVSNWVADHMGLTLSATRGALRVVDLVSRVSGRQALESASGGLHRLSGRRLPNYLAQIPGAGRKVVPASSAGDAEVVYFPACPNRGFGPQNKDDAQLGQVIESLLDRAGWKARLPERPNGLCCGLPFASRGQEKAADRAMARLRDSLREASDGGRLPILCDASPCTRRMVEQLGDEFRVLEPAAFINRHLLADLRIVRRVPDVLVHLSCSTRKLGCESDMLALADACAENVTRMAEKGCCGFAGDKGLSRPELNASALAGLKKQVPNGCKWGVSNSRTCEIGLTRHSGVTFRNIAYLVDYCSTTQVSL